MSTKQTTLIDEPTTDHTSRPASTTTTDATTVQNLEPGDVITAAQLTRRQNRKYLENDDTTLMDIDHDETQFVVLDTPDEDDEIDIFAAKLICLDTYQETTKSVKEISHAYTYDNSNSDVLETWNITAPQVPYNNDGTGVVISRFGQNDNPVRQILRDISITGQEEL